MFTNFTLKKSNFVGIYRPIFYKNYSTASSDIFYSTDIYYIFTDPIVLFNTNIPVSNKYKCKNFEFKPYLFDGVINTYNSTLKELNIKDDDHEIIIILFYDIKPNFDDKEKNSQLMLDIFSHHNNEGINLVELYNKYNLVSYIVTFKSILDSPDLKEEDFKIKNVIFDLIELEENGIKLNCIDGPLYCSISISSKFHLVQINNELKLGGYKSSL